MKNWGHAELSRISHFNTESSFTNRRFLFRPFSSLSRAAQRGRANPAQAGGRHRRPEAWVGDTVHP